MLRNKSLLRSLLLIVTLVFFIVGCSGGGQSGNESSDSSDTDTQNSEVESTDSETGEEESNDITDETTDGDTAFSEVIVVTSGGGLPHSYIDENDEWTGLDADVWEEIGERKGWDITHLQTEFASIFGELSAGRAHVASNGLGITEERTENYDPSIPYYASVNAFGLSEENSDLTEISDLAGKRVAVETGGATEPIVHELSEQYGFEVVNYEDSAAALNDLGLGRIDAFANDETYIRNYAEETGANISIMDEKINASNCGFFYLPDNENAQQLREEVDEVIKAMLDDGTLATLTEEWLGDDMTQYIEVE